MTTQPAWQGTHARPAEHAPMMPCPWPHELMCPWRIVAKMPSQSVTLPGDAAAGSMGAGRSGAAGVVAPASAEALAEQIVQRQADLHGNEHNDDPLQRVALPVLQYLQEVLRRREGAHRGGGKGQRVRRGLCSTSSRQGPVGGLAGASMRTRVQAPSGQSQREALPSLSPLPASARAAAWSGPAGQRALRLSWMRLSLDSSVLKRPSISSSDRKKSQILPAAGGKERCGVRCVWVGGWGGGKWGPGGRRDREAAGRPPPSGRSKALSAGCSSRRQESAQAERERGGRQGRASAAADAGGLTVVDVLPRDVEALMHAQFVDDVGHDDVVLCHQLQQDLQGPTAQCVCACVCGGWGWGVELGGVGGLGSGNVGGKHGMVPAHDPSGCRMQRDGACHAQSCKGR